MTRYDLKKNLKDRLTDGSMLMLVAATVAILFMNAHHAAAPERAPEPGPASGSGSAAAVVDLSGDPY